MQEIMAKFPFIMLPKFSHEGLCILSCHVRFEQLFHFLKPVHLDSNSTQFSLHQCWRVGNITFAKCFGEHIVQFKRVEMVCTGLSIYLCLGKTCWFPTYLGPVSILLLYLLAFIILTWIIMKELFSYALQIFINLWNVHISKWSVNRVLLVCKESHTLPYIIFALCSISIVFIYLPAQ